MSLNLDLVGLGVSSVTVDGRTADWSRDGQELTVTPRRPLKERQRFDVVVRYRGVPVELEIPGYGIPAGFMTTPDGRDAWVEETRSRPAH